MCGPNTDCGKNTGFGDEPQCRLQFCLYLSESKTFSLKGGWHKPMSWVIPWMLPRARHAGPRFSTWLQRFVKPLGLHLASRGNPLFKSVTTICESPRWPSTLGGGTVAGRTRASCLPLPSPQRGLGSSKRAQGTLSAKHHQRMPCCV